MLDFHAAVAPLRDAVDEIARGHFAVVPEDLHEYFRDVHDHLRRVAAGSPASASCSAAPCTPT